VNPFNGQTLKTYPEMTAEEVDAAIATAHESFATWRRVPFSQRATVLRRAAGLCRDRIEELARFMTLEMGKRIAEGRKEVELCARIFEYYADRGEELLRPENIERGRRVANQIEAGMVYIRRGSMKTCLSVESKNRAMAGNVARSVFTSLPTRSSFATFTQPGKTQQ
jgi:acyl-CoA reductase-like NAD-dependent aldehyde dehydrogenase